MFALIITIHIIACAMLILIVLVQQGRGGGLIETFSSAESIFGTKTSSFLVKSTTVLAIVFFFTCLALAFMSIQKSRSLVERYQPSAAATQAPAQTPDSKASAAQSQAAAPAQVQPAPQTAQEPAAPAEAPKTAEPAAVNPPGNEQQ
ncbi:MAG: preprotein translocase subunit SecG [Candidatus Omnitrophota bacterium]|jgi:preprotein translocase subunit SecG|nr:preprotein translocase subunit SecG [Candidatus Omnitrophota bacterium]MDD5137583.1 preprotein translocase subunit SecG [Candidatus Omnitrophota bacterium]MDD5537489.1 preprotein translocase subunit SecG [Candidatus Omnitrophota bacterium]